MHDGANVAGTGWAYLPEPHHEARVQAEDPDQPITAKHGGLG